MSAALNYYYYRLLLPDGRLRSGFSQFMVERDFSVQLYLERQHKAVVLSLHRVPDHLSSIVSFFRGIFSVTVSNRDLAGLLRDLGVMLRSGIPMIDALKTIVSEMDSNSGGGGSGVHRAAEALQEELSNGESISQAFARHPDMFPEIVCNLALIGDESGKLSEMFMEASDYLKRLSEIGGNARRSMIYPLFVFTAILGAAGFWLYYVIPNLSELFRQMNAKMPPLTLAFLSFADWLVAHAWMTLTILLLMIFLPILLVRHSERARLIFYRILHRLPVSGILLRTSGMAFLTEHLSILVRSGIDMAQSLKILERATGDEYYRKSVVSIRETMQRGEHLSVAMRATRCYPPLVLRLVAVGEETGTLDDQLAYLADEYRQRFQHLVETLAEVIRPAIILLAGAFFILVIIVLLLPVYDLIRQSMLIGS
ncbi:type II secretion system protein [Betaproteobacteria bacterium]|nr:type II secretion system protein [Betaproteobacteria bacterium]GHU13390.1 type II secretion system protein [Betaproteobacteria bacterium]GHU44924.1 type II secretion system protein [Betaproteobacteria bacterium]